jgi:hypothetical protein
VGRIHLVESAAPQIRAVSREGWLTART